LKVITIALSCIRTIDAEHMPYLLRFLLLSATPVNVRRIISQIREQLKFVGVSNSRASQHNKLKGKSLVNNAEASILDALRSSLRFKNVCSLLYCVLRFSISLYVFHIAFCICCYPQLLCQEILKELNCLEKPRDHKVIDIWLLMLIYSNSESLQKSIEKMFKKKVIEDCIEEVMFDQCICGNKELVQVSMTIIWFKEYFTSILYVLKLYLGLIKFH
jgi:Fanconi anemia group D2 protein